MKKNTKYMHRKTQNTTRTQEAQTREKTQREQEKSAMEREVRRYKLLLKKEGVFWGVRAVIVFVFIL